MRLLVTGATGNVGTEVVAALVAGGHDVRALVRDAKARSTDGATPVEGDLDHPETLGKPLVGVDGLFLLPGYADMPGILEIAAQARVARVVLLSGGSAGSGDTTNAVTAYMMRSESAVRESGLEWTILRPSAFMANVLRWRPQLRAGSTVRLPFANVYAAMVDPFDIAAVAAVALTADGHDGRIYLPTGPQSLRPVDQVAIVADVLGRDLRFEAQSDDEARVEMSATMPAQYVDAFFDFYVAGSLDESQVRPTVRDVTGRDPRTLAQWTRSHAAVFAADS